MGIVVVVPVVVLFVAIHGVLSSVELPVVVIVDDRTEDIDIGESNYFLLIPSNRSFRLRQRAVGVGFDNRRCRPNRICLLD